MGKFLQWWHGRDVWRRIGRHGWTAIYVGDYRSTPTWVYSVGFDETLNQPEIAVFDVPQETANALLWKAFEALKAGTLVLEDGKDWTDDGMPGRCVWRKVHPSQIDNPDNWFGFANIRREKRTGRRFGLEAFQLVLSDEAGHMPWDHGYDEQLRPRQPALYLPAEDAAKAAAMNPEESEARRLVRERGWTAVPVDGPELSWAYTIGLNESFGAPDLIAFGPPGKELARMLVDVQAHLRDSCLVLSDGLRWNALRWAGRELEVCFRRVDESQYLGFNWFYLAKEIRQERTGKREPVEVYQLFLPDDADRYPWEDGCDEGMRLLQPLLYMPFGEEEHTARALAATRRL